VETFKVPFNSITPFDDQREREEMFKYNEHRIYSDHSEDEEASEIVV
jgi:hypothetical protein